jgi:hypothetical protein
VVTGTPVGTRRRIAWLMTLAVLALVLSQVAAVPIATASWQDQAVNQASTSKHAELGEQEPAVPCRHHGNAQGPLCCSAGDCPMLVLSLPASAPAMHPMTRHELAYVRSVVHPPPGTNAAPLLPPPRSLA